APALRALLRTAPAKLAQSLRRCPFWRASGALPAGLRRNSRLRPKLAYSPQLRRLETRRVHCSREVCFKARTPPQAPTPQPGFISTSHRCDEAHTQILSPVIWSLRARGGRLSNDGPDQTRR